jgi:hypothetical protein
VKSPYRYSSGLAFQTVENQQLMLGKNGFCKNGPHTAGLNDSHQRRNGMDEEDDEIAYPLS